MYLHGGGDPCGARTGRKAGAAQQGGGQAEEAVRRGPERCEASAVWGRVPEPKFIIPRDGVTAGGIVFLRYGGGTFTLVLTPWPLTLDHTVRLELIPLQPQRRTCGPGKTRAGGL